MREIVLSFLGTGDYVPCHYQLGDETAGTHAFVQVALHDLLTRSGHAIDRFYVFLTPAARAKKWNDLRDAWGDGRTCLEAVDISEKATDDNFWKIFTTVNTVAQDGDLIHLDITHSFRYLPLLGYAVGEYLETVRSIEISGIYYGAFEELGNRDQVQALPEDQRIVPVRTLTAFYAINRWTQALQSFERFGSTELLKRLASQRYTPLLRETKGRDSHARAMRRLVDGIDTWAECIRSARAREIMEFCPSSAVIAPIDELDHDFIPAMKREIGRLRSRFSDIPDASLQTLWHAILWCDEKGLVQQGFTLLSEGLISLFTARWRENLVKISPEPDRRIFVASYLNWRASPSAQPQGLLSDYPIITASLANEAIPECFAEITQIRNDINHAGMTDNHIRDVRKLQNKLKTLIEAAGQWLNGKL